MSLINFSGIASGIDSNALIDAMIDAQRQVRVTPSEDKITELEDTNSSMDELKTKVLALRDATTKFTTLSGGGISKQAASSDESTIAATASNAATDGTYTATVTALAKNATGSFDYDFTSSTSAVSALGGTVSITIGSGASAESFDITVNAGTTTVSDFVNQFNSETEKAVASLVKIDEDQYRIVISTNQQGTAEGSLSVLSTATDFDTLTIDDADDAVFSISGIGSAITRSTNTISDVIPGLTFSLQNIGAATISVSTDVTSTTTTVQDFVDAYNEIVTYMAENNGITRDDSGAEIENIWGPLAQTKVDDNLLTALRAGISGATYTSGSEIRIFADLGITTERDGTLKFDEDTFSSALAKEPNSVNEVLRNFGDTVATTTGTIAQFTRFGGLFDITTRANQSTIDDLKKRIVEAEAYLTRQRENLVARFARLESMMGKLQGQQSALTSALSGLSS